jgi:hypothetical protein
MRAATLLRNAPVRRLSLAAALSLGAAVAQAQQPGAAESHTYTLTAQQRTALYAALAGGDFWLAVKTQAAGNTLEGHAMALSRAELNALVGELTRQERAAAEKAAAEKSAAEPPK